MPEEPHLEEKAIAQVVEAGLSNQLDDVENLNVEVQTDLGKIVRGQARSVSVEGKGLVVQEDIRVEAIEVHTNHVSINPLSALLGQIKLDHPVNTTMRIELTEADINNTMNSDYVQQKLQPLELDVDGEMVTLALKPPIEVQLLETGRLGFNASAVLHRQDKTRSITFAAVICPPHEQQPELLLEGFDCRPGEGLSLEVITALMKKFKAILNLPYLEIEGIKVRLYQIDVREGSMTVTAEALVNEIPSL